VIVGVRNIMFRGVGLGGTGAYNRIHTRILVIRGFGK
jgi:hypothetical protein